MNRDIRYLRITKECIIALDPTEPESAQIEEILRAESEGALDFSFDLDICDEQGRMLEDLH